MSFHFLRSQGPSELFERCDRRVFSKLAGQGRVFPILIGQGRVFSILVKQGRVLAVNANNVRLVNLVNQTIQELIRVHCVHRANTKKKKDKPRVTDVF